jgi:hypothetical protein
MKSFIIKINVLAACAALLAGLGCTKDFKEINTNPVLVTKDLIKPALLFTPVLKNSVFDLYSRGPVGEYSGYCLNPAGGDVFLNQNFDDPFGTFYKSYLINVAEVIRLTADKPLLSNENAMARIWKVWLFHQLTDAYGDIPYFDAVKEVDSMNTQPKYDAQQDIYADMFRELKEATAQLSDDPDQESFGAADVLLQGDVDRWRRFANSLRLRLALRVRYVDPALAQQNISDVLNQPLIEENAQNVALATLNDGNTENDNPFYEVNLRQPLNMVVSFTVTDNLKRLNDPRLPVFAKPAVAPTVGYRGVPIQLTDEQKHRYINDSTSLMGDAFLQPVINIIVINAAEVYFLRAEAALAGLSSEDAQDLYGKGIQASMDQYGIDPGQTASYLASAAGTLAGTDEEKLEQLITQKWIGNYYETNEGWAEFRRTGYPRIWTGGMLGNTNGNVPRRLIYSGDEYFKNTDNVKAAASRLSNGDSYMSRIWWDAKPGLPFYHPKQGSFPPEE